MYVVIYLFCKFAFPQLSTFLIFYRKRLWYLSCLLIWSHFPFPILLLKTVVRYWDSSCLGEEWFPMGQCPLLVTVICCCMMWFSPILGVHIKALGVFIVSAEDIESRGEVGKYPQFEEAAPADWCHRISDLKCSSVTQWTQKMASPLLSRIRNLFLWPLFTPESQQQPELCLLVSVSSNWSSIVSRTSISIEQWCIFYNFSRLIRF